MFKYFDKEIIDLVNRYEKGVHDEKLEFFDSEEYLEIIHFFQSIGDEYSLRELLEIAVEQYPNSADILLCQAWYYLAMQMDNKAMEIVRYVESFESYDEEIYFIKAIIYTRRGEFENSDKMLALAEEYGADELDLLIGRAEQLCGKKRSDEAYFMLNEKMDDILEEDDYFAQLIRFASDTNHLSDLEKELEKRSSNDPFNTDIKKRLVEFYTETGRLADAVSINSFVLAINPNDEQALQFMENVREVSVDILQAVSDNAQSLSLSEQEYYSIIYTAEHYEKDGQFDVARDYYFRLAEAPIHREATFLRLGRSACLSGLYASGRFYLEKSLFIMRENQIDDFELESEVYHWLSRTYEGLGDLGKMIECDLAAAERSPENKDFLYVYILDLCEEKQFDLAEKYLDKVSKDEEMFGSVLLMRGAVKFFQKKFDEAATFFHQAFQSDEQTTEDAEIFLDEIKGKYPLEEVLSEFYRCQLAGH
ncbi:MAG: hypothetical protein LBQ31_06585 [Bacteroidales bacterium]|jgi:Tfp pilus assembly protein PilF|nr:hypothetical protein [Bacteroidales bacterium]